VRNALWFLLRQTVEGAETPHQIDGMDADDLVVWHQRRERVEGDAVAWIVERRDDDDAIGDVEVRIAGWQPFAVHDDRPGERKLHDAQWRMAVARDVLEPSQVVEDRA
jgi:hypothetical protein